MAEVIEKAFIREMESLDPLFDFVDKFFTDYGISDSIAYKLRLALEEVFTNLVKYDASAASEIPVRLALDRNRVIICVINKQGNRFDFDSAKKVDVSAPLKKRPIGGLGIHLIKNMVDELLHDYKDGVSTITIVKSLEEESA
jgi:anti-sigma regulatory factor (Ser/Thr protein kinase)